MRKSMLLEAPLAEYEDRILRLTQELQRRGMDGIILSAPDNMRYFCGHRSIVWDSNVSMPGTLIVAADGAMRLAGSQSNNPTAVATSCVDEDCFIAYFNGGHAAPSQTRSYPEAVLKALHDLGLAKGKIGMEWGRGCRVRMIHADYEAILAGMPGAAFVDASDVIWALRSIKSPYEQELLRKVNNINTKLFEHVFQRVVPGVTTERQLYNSIASEAYDLGCDGMLEMDVRCGKERYALGNCPPSELPVSTEEGTIMMVDGGPCYHGYFSDIIRLGVVGKPTARQKELYQISLEGHAAGMEMIRPGVRISDVCAAVDGYYQKAGVEAYNHTKGWVGHSLGLNVHEYPCLETGEEMLLRPGMAMTLEPCLSGPDVGPLVLEQNFIVTETGYELLSKMPADLIPLY